MVKRAIVYRSCDRPKYVRKTLPLLLDRTSNTPILVYDNSTRDGRRQEVREALEFAISSRNKDVIVVFDDKERIGGTNALIRATQRLKDKYANLIAVMNVDDDIVVPMPLKDGRTWDDILFEMIDAGWEVVAHPWSDDFRIGNDIEEVGGVIGYPFSGVGGGCSAFSLEFYEKHPMQQTTLIRGYNEWMVRWAGKCGYSHDGDMLIEHIDRPDHPWSLRDTEYDEWATEMYWERFPDRRGKERPKGSRGIW